MALECPFSLLSKPHNVFRRDSLQLFRCYVCNEESKEYSESYYCSTCGKESHIGCYKFQPEIKQHPYHPFHSLTLITTPSNSNSLIPNSWPDDEVISPPDENLGGCKCCRRQLQGMYYHCSICKFSINATCAINPPPLTIVNPKSHEHTTFAFFPRRISLPCDACGVLLDKGSDHVYTCLSSNYIAHRKCIEELPCVIKITRHIHRLWHTPSLFSPDIPSLLVPAGFSCGVCHKPVKVNYGQYSCLKGCHYVVHSKCATRKDVWDGKELRGVPEELEEYGGVELFRMIDDETILHCNHEHYLKFSGENNGLCDGSNFCQACLLLIMDSDSLYSCKQCNFILHEACALLPRKIAHPLHKHPLTLFPLPTNLYLIQFKVFVEGMFKCSGCHQRGCGFMYRCSEKGCRFQLDVRCASLAESFIHGSHGHPLFLSLNKGKCMRCDTNQCSPFYLECTECTLFLGLKCAMLPSVAHYKSDRHPLTLCYGEKITTSGQYWCELCESKLHSSEWFYTCDICKITLHVTCFLGKEVYMKPQHTIKINDEKVEIVRNNGNPRPFCDKCTDRCVDALVLFIDDLRKYCCTLQCMQKVLDREKQEKEQKGEGEGAMTRDLDRL